MNILSIDWDVFFPGATDVHGRCGACSWWCESCDDGPSLEHKRPGVTTLSKWWEYDAVRAPADDPVKMLRRPKLPKTKAPTLCCAECHADIWPLIGRRDFVLNVDAHHDCWDTCANEDLVNYPDDWRRWVHCGNWAYLAQEQLGVQYQHYSDENLAIGDPWTRHTFQKVFVCQSRPWTPTGWDRRFYRFLRDLYRALGCKSVEFLGPHAARIQRNFEKGKS